MKKRTWIRTALALLLVLSTLCSLPLTAMAAANETISYLAFDDCTASKYVTSPYTAQVQAQLQRVWTGYTVNLTMGTIGTYNGEDVKKADVISICQKLSEGESFADILTNIYTVNPAAQVLILDVYGQTNGLDIPSYGGKVTVVPVNLPEGSTLDEEVMSAVLESIYNSVQAANDTVDTAKTSYNNAVSAVNTAVPNAEKSTADVARLEELLSYAGLAEKISGEITTLLKDSDYATIANLLPLTQLSKQFYDMAISMIREKLVEKLDAKDEAEKIVLADYGLVDTEEMRDKLAVAAYNVAIAYTSANDDKETAAMKKGLEEFLPLRYPNGAGVSADRLYVLYMMKDSEAAVKAGLVDPFNYPEKDVDLIYMVVKKGKEAAIKNVMSSNGAGNNVDLYYNYATAVNNDSAILAALTATMDSVTAAAIYAVYQDITFDGTTYTYKQKNSTDEQKQTAFASTGLYNEACLTMPDQDGHNTIATAAKTALGSLYWIKEGNTLQVRTSTDLFYAASYQSSGKMASKALTANGSLSIPAGGQAKVFRVNADRIPQGEAITIPN